MRRLQHVFGERLSGAGAERGFSPAQLLPLVALVVAGSGEGVFSGPGQHRFGIRASRAFAELRDEPAERHLSQGLCASRPAAGLYALQCVPARPLPLPVLRG